MLTSPKLILPFQIARIQKYFEAQVRFAWHRDVDLPVLGSAGCQPAAFGTLPNATRFRQAAGTNRLAACAPRTRNLRRRPRAAGARFRGARINGSMFLRAGY